MELNNPQVKEVMDINELAEYLGIGKSKIYVLIRQKKIPASKIGRQYRFSKSVIDAWLREKIITGEQTLISGTELFQQVKEESKQVEGGNK